MLLSVNPNYPEPRKIRRAVDALEAGEVIGYPTDTVYGLGCDLFNKRAIERLYQIKRMDQSQKLVVHLPRPQQRRALRHRRGRDVPRPEEVPARPLHVHPRGDARSAEDHSDQAQNRRRPHPDHPVILALVQAFGRPLISTTAAPARRRTLRRSARDRRSLQGARDGARRGRRRPVTDDGHRSDDVAYPEIIREGAGIGRGLRALTPRRA